MMILALSTSSEIASAAVLQNGCLIAEDRADSTQKHAVTTIPLIQDLLVKHGITLDQIDVFAVDIGPVSFTGIRIGICTINAFAFAFKKPVIPVTSLRVLAQPHLEKESRVCALIDAGHDSVYTALYENGTCVHEPSIQVTTTLLAELMPDTMIVQGEVPIAANVALAAWQLREKTETVASPLYVQPSQAERLYQERNGALDHV